MKEKNFILVFSFTERKAEKKTKKEEEKLKRDLKRANTDELMERKKVLKKEAENAKDLISTSSKLLSEGYYLY